MKQEVRKTLLLGLVLLLSASLAFAQGIVTGSISGSVQDQQGAIIQGAKVTARDTGTNREFTTESNAEGHYSLRALPVGTYNVTIDAANFSKLNVANVVVNIAKDTSLGPQALSIGTTDVINVESTPPLVEASTTQISSTFSNQDAINLPIGIGFDALALYVPGVASAGDNGFSNTNGADITANGQRGRSNNFMIDGQNNNDNSIAGPLLFVGNADVLGEFQVITNYSAEFGRNTGSVINYVTKSGTNNFHGTLFEFHQNSIFDSLRNQEKSTVFGFCAQGADPNGPDGLPNTGDECGVINAPFREIENRFGGTFGGPVIKDKFWFFGSQFWQRNRTSGNLFTSAPNATPTPAGIAALQAAYPGNIAVAALNAIGPYSRTQGNPVIGGPTTDVFVSDGVTITPIEFAPVQRVLSQPFNNYELVGRGDIQITDKDRFFARYLFQRGLNDNASGTAPNFAAGYVVDVPFQTQQIGVDWTRTFSPRFVNTFRFNYGRADIGFENGTVEGCNRANLTACPTRIDLAGLNLDFGQATNFPQGRLLNNSQWQDNASYVHGRHTLKFGGEYTRQRSPNIFLPNINGIFSYSTAAATCPAGVTAANVAAGNGFAPTACSFSKFLRNTTTSFTLADGNPRLNFKEQDFALYFQDEWRVKDNLTVILGMRYEYAQQAINLLAQQTLDRQTGPNPFWDPSLPLDRTTVPFIPTDTNNWAPNIGFAWTPRFWQGLFGQDKTVIRGGFRLSYDPAFYNMFLNVATAAPVLNLGTINAAVAIPAGSTSFSGEEVRPTLLPLLPTGVGIDPGFRAQTRVANDFHSPYTQQWNFGIQRQITSKMAAEVRYVGNHSVGLFQSFNANPALNVLIANGFGGEIPSGLTPCTDATGGLGGTPMPGFLNGHVDCARRNVVTRGNTAFSIYHGLQSRLDISNWHGLTGRINYTWSKNIDNSSEVFSTVAGGNTLSFAQNPFDINRAERAISGIDFPHVASIALIYDLPFYKKQEGFLGHLLGGWQWGSTWRYSSGQPNTVIQFKEGPFCDPTNTLSAGFDACRPILGNLAAPIDAVGRCTDNLLADCGLISEDTGNPIAASDVHWIINDPVAALFFGSPFLGAGRSTVRGQTLNTANLSLIKNTKVTERVNVQFHFQIFNVLNHQFLGNPDVLAQDLSFAAGGSFMNTAFNNNGNFQANNTENGIDQRRLSFGLKIIF